MEPSAQPQSESSKFESLKTWALKLGVLALAVVWLVLMATTWAQASEPSSAPQASDEYNFKWLDPDKKIYVLQNRRYLKSDHGLLSMTVGPGWSNPYRTTWALTPRVAFFFNESWGIETFYSVTFNSQNSTFKALQSTGTNIFPVVREIKNEFGAMLDWVPWYAKINVFNQILYFDWYFSGGAGSVQSQAINQNASGTTVTNQSNFGAFFGTGQIFHISEMWKVRMDVMGAYYRAPLNGTTGDSTWFSNYKFELGLGVQL